MIENDWMYEKVVSIRVRRVRNRGLRGHIRSKFGHILDIVAEGSGSA